MNKFHISKDGIARKCNAQTPESCTATPADQKEHYGTKEEAQQAYEARHNQNSNEWLGSVNKQSHQQEPFTKQSLLEENLAYMDQFKILEIERKELVKDKLSISSTMEKQTLLAMKMLDNAWDLKELTGTRRDLKNYKLYRKNALKTTRKEIAALNKEIENWRDLYSMQNNQLNEFQKDKVRELGKRKKSAENFSLDLENEINREKGKLHLVEY